jgi:opacity protein-like surface antigen
MKKAWLLGVLMCWSPAAMAQTGGLADKPTEVSGSVVYFFPSQQFSGFYDNMKGVEFQYTYWVAMPVGVSVTTGLMDAEVRTNNKHLVDPKVGTFKDSATMLPIGLSLLYNIADTQDWRVYGEAGLRYVIIDSDIKLRSAGTGKTQSVSLDNGSVGVLRVNVSRRLSEQWALFGSAGVQVDIAAGDVSVGGEKLGDDNLKGYSWALGAQYLF